MSTTPNPFPHWMLRSPARARLERVAPVREALVAEVHSEFAAVEIADGVIDPIAGALWRARRGA